jgi:hypothetical protein
MEDFLTCNVCQDVVSSKIFDMHRLSHFAKATKNEVVFEKSESKYVKVKTFKNDYFLLLKFKMVLGHKVEEIIQVRVSPRCYVTICK